MGLFNNKRDDEVPQQDLLELFQRLEHLERKCRRLEKRIEALETKEEPSAPGLSHPQELAPNSLAPSGLAEEAAPVETQTEPADSASALTPCSPAAVASEDFYLPAPTPDGLFEQASAREQVGKSIYQLTTQDGLNGTFILLDTPDAIATAMISVSTFVKPVCKVLGSTARLPRHIITEEEGTATREGTSWRVVRKAVVRFVDR